MPTPLIPCPTCACHFRAGAPRCPHCGATLSRSVRSGARTAAAVVLALALAGCPGAENGPAPAEPPEAEIADVPEITEIPKVAPVLPVPPAPEPAEPAPPPPTPPEPEPEPDPVLPPDDGGMHALYGVPSTWDPPAPRIR